VKIRGLTFEPHGAATAQSVLPRSGTAAPTDSPRDSPVVRSVPPQEKAVKRVARSLDEVLDLPDDVHCDQLIPALNNKESVKQHCLSLGLKPRVTAVVVAVFNSKELSREIYKDLWNGPKKFYILNGTPAYRLLNAHSTIENQTYANNSRDRINALLFAIHFQTLCDSIHQDGESERTLQWQSKETVVMEKLINESQKTKSQIQNLLKRGRWYRQWIIEMGVGGILMLGASMA
jgi:hypothetical protein